MRILSQDGRTVVFTDGKLVMVKEGTLVPVTMDNKKETFCPKDYDTVANNTKMYGVVVTQIQNITKDFMTIGVFNKEQTAIRIINEIATFGGKVYKVPQDVISYATEQHEVCGIDI